MKSQRPLRGKISCLILAVAILMLGGQLSSPIQRASLETELAQLKERGLTYRVLDNTTIEINEQTTGFKRVKTLQEPSEAEIRAWAAQRGIPLLEINPATIDTNLYAGRYRYWTQIPISNDIGSRPVVGDIDRDGKAEAYGLYKEYSMFDPLARIYEVDSVGTATLQHTYLPFPGVADGIADIDKNGRLETYWIRSYVIRFFEQSAPSVLPTDFLLSYSTIEQNLGVSFSSPVAGFIDEDCFTDILYYGTFADSTDTSNTLVGLAIAEFDSTSRSFRRVWSQQHMEDVLGGLSVGDFDCDGHTEFVCSFSLGNVIMNESFANDGYRLVWRDSIAFVNLLYGGAGDVDNDGKPEFFRGATMSNGNWTLMYEADSNNHYSARFLFHLLSGGTFDEPDYQVIDVDRDGRLELVIFSGATLYVFKSGGDDSYYLWHLKREGRGDGIQFYDFNGDGKKDFIISKIMSNGTSLRYYSDIYLADRLTPVMESETPLPSHLSLSQNYPNPFNSRTTITYTIGSQQNVRLVVLDILGKEVTVLVEGTRENGKHAVGWNATNFASGIYFYRLEAGGNTITHKMLLLR